MKKYLLLGLLVFIPLFTKAEVFGFLNGNFYDINGNLKYACLEDGSCYNYSNQQMTTLNAILGVSTTTPSTITITTGSPTPTPTPDIQYVYIPEASGPTPTPSDTPEPTVIPMPTPTPTPIPFSITNFYMDNSGIFTFTSNEEIDFSNIKVTRSDDKMTFPFIFNVNNKQINNNLIIYTGTTGYTMNDYLNMTQFGRIDTNDQESYLFIKIIIPDILGDTTTIEQELHRLPNNFSDPSKGFTVSIINAGPSALYSTDSSFTYPN